MSANGPSTAGWMAHQIQLIVFPVDPLVGMEQDWFYSVTATEPETTKTRARREDQAEVKGRLVSLVSELGKIAWTEQIIFNPEDPPLEMPSLGTFAEASERFSAMMKEWLGRRPSTRRMAFASKIVIPTAGREESYELLSRYLADSVKIDKKNSSDFNYRINRPRKSETAGGRKINRLVQWSAIRIEMTLQSSVTPNEVPAIRQALHGCTAALDINTDQEDKNPIPPDNVLKLWEELKGMGIEIAEKGDVA